jgi:hypothetical protein
LYFPPGGDIVFGDGTVQTTAFTGTVDLANVASNIVPAANVTYSLGNSTNQWKDLWVSNSTIYINSVPLTVDGTTLQVDGANVVTASANGVVDLADVSVTGNVAGNVGAFNDVNLNNAATNKLLTTTIPMRYLV